MITGSGIHEKQSEALYIIYAVRSSVPFIMNILGVLFRVIIKKQPHERACKLVCVALGSTQHLQ